MAGRRGEERPRRGWHGEEWSSSLVRGEASPRGTFYVARRAVAEVSVVLALQTKADP